MLYGTVVSKYDNEFPEDTIMYPDDVAELDIQLDDLKMPALRKIVETIDKNIIKVYPDGEVTMTSPIFGSASISDLSTGSKTMMIAYLGLSGIVRSDHMGDNCFPLLAELAREKDIHIYLTHSPLITFPIYVTNVNKLINDWVELASTVARIQRRMEGIYLDIVDKDYTD